MLKTYTADDPTETAPQEHRKTILSKKSTQVSSNRIHGVTISVESAREGTGAWSRCSRCKAISAGPDRLYRAPWVPVVKDGVEQADCKATSEVLNHGLLHLTATVCATVQGMIKIHTKKSTAEQDFEEDYGSHVSKLFGTKTYRSNDGLSLRFGLDHRLYVQEGGGETDSSESKTEIYHRVRLESPGQQITEFRFLNSKALEQDEEACKRFAPALKRVGFRFRRVLPKSRDARRVPRERYVFTISGSPEKRGLDGELYRTKAGPIEPAGETHKSKSGDTIVTEAWRLIAGESKGKIVSTRGGYHKAIRRSRNEQLLDEHFLNADDAPIAPNYSTLVFSAETLKKHPHCAVGGLSPKQRCVLRARQPFARKELDRAMEQYSNGNKSHNSSTPPAGWYENDPQYKAARAACDKIVDKPCKAIALGPLEPSSAHLRRRVKDQRDLV